MSESPYYETGGTLRFDAACYVERGADKELFDALLQGEFCYVLTSRQMGKSSLMVRTTAKLRKEGVNVVAEDLTAIGQNLTPEQWYDGLVVKMASQLELENELENFWLDHERISPVQRLFSAIREVVLVRRSGRFVMFVDEIDSVRSLPFSSDEFFAAIRECYNERTQDPELNRLTFCLLGVATPADLMRDPRQTPFNIGQRIELCDFSMEEAAVLAKGLGREEARSGALLERLLYWTHGHPYLTQRLCRAIKHNPDKTEPDDVDRFCEELFFSCRARERDDNLLFVRERILRTDKGLASLLGLYRQVHQGLSVADDDANPLIEELRLSGITRVEKGRLVVRNEIYYRVFDEAWVEASMPAPAPQQSTTTLAVMPFTNLSTGQDTEYFCDGLTEALISVLGEVPNFRVVSGGSAFRFKEKPLEKQEIAVQLGVRWVLSGRVRMLGTRAGINLQLHDAEPNRQVWLETFRYSTEELLGAQHDIARAIVGRLRAEIGPGTISHRVPPATLDIEAYNLYLKGRFYWNRRTEPAVRRSIELFQQALERDPDYALARAGLADAYNILGTYNYVRPADAYPKARVAAIQALELDDNLPQAHCALACASAVHQWDWPRAEMEFKRAIEINPSYVTAHQWYAINCLTPLGRHSEAIAELRQAQEVDPLSISLRTAVGLAYYFAERYEEAISHHRETIEMDENFWLTHLFLGWTCAQVGLFKDSLEAFQTSIGLGNGDPIAVAGLAYAQALSGATENARQTLDQLMKLAGTRYVPASEIMAVHVALGDIAQARQWLQKACEERSFKLIYLLVDPRLVPLRDLPEFDAARTKIGLKA